MWTFVRRAASLSLLLAVAACRPESREGAGAPTPLATDVVAVGPLSAHDLQMFLAVRNRALARVEEAVADAEQNAAGVLGRIEDLSVAEREAALALGFDWHRYRWAREEVARLLSAQRQREDARLLAVELGKARDDLQAQLKMARDAAARAFLEAQVASLKTQLEKLESERRLPPIEQGQLALIDGARAELAVQQGRQERLFRHVRELMDRSRAAGAPAAATRAPAPQPSK